jgi:hypothetical protein
MGKSITFAESARSRWRLWLGGALCALAAVALWRLWPNEEQRVLRRARTLAASFSKSPGESAAVMALKLQRFGALLADEVELNLLGFQGNGVYSGSEVQSLAARVRPGFRSLQLDLLDSTVRFPGGGEAVVEVSARLRVVDERGSPAEDTRPIRCHLRQSEGDWLFYRFDEIEVLRR